MSAQLPAILKAVCYADLFDMALTPQEIAHAAPALHHDGAGRGGPMRVEDIFEAMEDFEGRERLATEGGFVMLKGRERLACVRQARYALAEDKFRRALRFFRWARFVPFLRAAYVCNTLAKSNARTESDIDIFIVAASGRLWTSRMLVTALASLSGVRRHGEDVSDHLCLSFFVSEDALDLSPLAIEDDVYLANWLHELYPLYDENGITARLMSENAWAKAMRPASLAPAGSRRRHLAARLLPLKSFFERAIGGRAEAFAKKLQMRYIEAKWKTQDRRSSGVVVTDDILKFHENDRRVEFRDRHRAAVAKLASYDRVAA